MGKGKRKRKSKLRKRNGSLRSPQRLAGNAEQLLPGLQNDIVLEHIVPKLPWKVFHILSAVSPYWRDVIQSRQLHDVRARHNSLETLVVMNHLHPRSHHHTISLYFSKENSWHRLPQLPFCKKEIPPSCHCVALEGSLYVLGGDPHAARAPNTGREVFVMDLVGQRGWKCCADLPKPSYLFACGVLNGKIYVLGGYANDKKTNACWVYDPKEDHWSSIAPMSSKRSDHHVVAVGDELWVHGGLCEKALNLEVYNPAKDEWAFVQSQHCYKHLFTMKGEPYLITPFFIYGREESAKSKCWTKRQFIDYNIFPGDYYTGRIVGAQAVDHEVLVMFAFDDSPEGEISLYRSDGFGTGSTKHSFGMGRMCKGRIYLQKVEEEIFEDEWYAPLMCPIDL